MLASAEFHRSELISIVQASPWFMTALAAVASLNLTSWCIGAGAVRNLVWDRLHEYEKPSVLSDIDVVYFDAVDLSSSTEKRLQAALEAAVPDVRGRSRIRRQYTSGSKATSAMRFNRFARWRKPWRAGLNTQHLWALLSTKSHGFKSSRRGAWKISFVSGCEGTPPE
jgi:hypothetical protein